MIPITITTEAEQVEQTAYSRRAQLKELVPDWTKFMVSYTWPRPKPAVGWARRGSASTGR